jgi:uncharacterized protein (DUF302 family)
LPKQEPNVTLPDNGMVHLRSAYSALETMARLEALVVAHGMSILVRIDHSGDATKAGLQMQPAQLLIFGNPKAGTPPMIAAPTLALDLPLKALVWQEFEGRVWLSFNSPEYLKQRHNVPDDLIRSIAGAHKLFEEATAGK